MAPTTLPERAPRFEFDFYRFNGKGNLPTLVPSPDQANFIRSRYSVDERLIETAIKRVLDWAADHGIAVSPKQPFPSSQTGKYWIEFRFGGLSL